MKFGSADSVALLIGTTAIGSLAGHSFGDRFTWIGVVVGILFWITLVLFDKRRASNEEE